MVGAASRKDFTTITSGGSGSSNGGSGGAGKTDYSGTPSESSYPLSAGGAGNPAGNTSNSNFNYAEFKDYCGTGGLLVIYANDFCNKSMIESNGTKGQSTNGRSAGGAGAGSGGGSINIFYHTNTSSSTTMNVKGGTGGTRPSNASYMASGLPGGSGGSGTVTKGSIASDSFVKQ